MSFRVSKTNRRVLKLLLIAAFIVAQEYCAISDESRRAEWERNAFIDLRNLRRKKRGNNNHFKRDFSDFSQVNPLSVPALLTMIRPRLVI